MRIVVCLILEQKEWFVGRLHIIGPYAVESGELLEETGQGQRFYCQIGQK